MGLYVNGERVARSFLDGQAQPYG